MAPSLFFRTLDYGVWKAFAGDSARVPATGDLVYYFPEGHAEHAMPPPDLYSLLRREQQLFLCRVSSVSLLVHPEGDKVYARISLDPNVDATAAPLALQEKRGERESFMSFVKVLTPSDANNGGGFSVPRFCADSIFPTLDYKVDPPMQSISTQDLHGNTWDFRHVYRGTPRRHLLTTGWSRFINSKKLVAGDSVVFCRSPAGKLFIGVRRTSRVCGGSITFNFSPDTKPKNSNGFLEDEGFLRCSGCWISSESVLEVVRSAEMRQPFEVLYFPKAGWPEFVVAKDLVEAAMAVPWGPGTRVKMAVETEEGSRTACYHGTICNSDMACGQWGKSLWRMLQVNWDEPELLQKAKTVNPWQVEFVSSSLSYPAMKRLKVTDANNSSFEEEEGYMALGTGFRSSDIGGLTSSPFNLNESPFGTQGARHLSSSPSTAFTPETTMQRFFSIDAWKSSASWSTSSTLEDGSDGDQPGTEMRVTDACEPRKARRGTIQLFGKIIHTAETSASTDFSLSFPHNLLLESQPRVPAIGACK